MNENIRHNGIITRICEDTIFVRIVQQSACAGCHARSMCSASESKVKEIEIKDRSGKYQIDEEVTICGQSSLGLQAVLLAFVWPLLLVIAAIVIGMGSGLDETISGVFGLLILIPYYLILYIMREKLKRKFVFTLEKHNNLL